MGAARQQVDRRIGAILRPEQQAAWEAWRAQRAAAAAAPATGRVHVLGPDGQPRAIAVRLGVGDGSFTEVSGEGIEPGTELVVGGGPRPAPAAGAAPAPGGPRLGM
jgi:HlyD family secretion protein